MPVLRLFAAAREVAGVARVEVAATTVDETLEEAERRYGAAFSDVLARSRVWLNGQPVPGNAPVQDHDVVSVLPAPKGERPAPTTNGSLATAPGSDAVDRAPGSGAIDSGAIDGAPGADTVTVSLDDGDDDTLWRPDVPRPDPAAVAQSAEAPVSDESLVEEPVLDEPDVDEPDVDEPDVEDVTDDSEPDEPDEPDKPDEPDRPDKPDEPEVDGFGFLAPRYGGLAPTILGTEKNGGGDGGEGPTPGGTVTVLELPGDGAMALGERVRVTAGGDAAAALRTSAVPVLDHLPEPEPEAEPKPDDVPAPRMWLAQPLAVVPSATRPHARLGLVWAIVTTAAVVAGQGWLAAWLGIVAFVAGSQTAAAWKSRNERPLPLLAAAGAAALPATAVLGLKYMTGAVIAAVIVTLLARLASPTKAPARDIALTLVIAVVVGLAAAAPVLLRGINIQAPLLLLGYAAAYDAGAYLIGTGASAAWEGPAAGVFTLIPVAMLSAVVLVPPFPEATPLVLGAIAALLAPFGPLAGSALLGDPTTDAPGLRRLDSLLLMGPLWAWCAAGFLQ